MVSAKWREKDGDGEGEREREGMQEEPGEKTTINWHMVNSGKQNSNYSYSYANLLALSSLYYVYFL